MTNCAFNGWMMGGAHSFYTFYPQTLKSTDRTQKHRDWWIPIWLPQRTSPKIKKDLKLLRQLCCNQIAPHVLNRWSFQLTASNILFVLVHKFPSMPCFDIFNLLYSHLTPRPNHKCPSSLLKSFSTWREWCRASLF